MSVADKEMGADAPTRQTEKETGTGSGEIAVEENGRALDDDVVDWAGEEDVEKPLNWKNKRKVKQILVICYNTFLTYA